MIDLVIYTENYFAGGLEQFILDVLKNKSFNIKLLVNHDNNRLINFATDNKINCTAIKLSQFKINRTGKFVRMANFILKYISMIPDYYILRKQIKKYSNYQNILIVNGGYPAALSCFSAAIAAKKSGFEMVCMSVLSCPSPLYTKKFFTVFQGRLDQITDNFIDLYIPNSQCIKTDILCYTSLQSEKIKVLYTGVDIPEIMEKTNSLDGDGFHIQRKKEDIWIAMIALLGSTKRQDILLDALGQITDKNVKLLIVGDGPNKKSLVQQITNLGLADRVVMTGWLSDPKIIYQFVDIIAFASDQEGLPYSISEAMSYGVPIVASAVGGVPEQIVDNKGGLLFDNTVSDLAEKILLLVQDENIKQEYSHFSLERVRNKFSVEVMYKELKLIFS